MSSLRIEKPIDPYHLVVPERGSPVYDTLRIRSEISGIYDQTPSAQPDFNPGPYVSPEKREFKAARDLVIEYAKDINDERELALDSVLFTYELRNRRRFGKLIKDFIGKGIGI